MLRMLLGVVLVCYAHAAAADRCPATTQDIHWSAACFEGSGAVRHVKERFRRQLRPDRHGMTVVLIDHPRELVAVDRHGRVAIPDIRHTGDFDYPDAPSGIARYYASVPAPGGAARKCGYFSTDRLDIVVPASFDHCQSFQGEETLACKACAMYCTGPDCQDTILAGGKGFVLDRHGNILKEIALPTLAQRCRHPAVPKVTPLAGDASMFQCIDRKGSPFTR